MEKKMKIYETKIVIDDYSRRLSELEKSLSVWDPITFSYSAQFYYFDEENNKLYLPRGIDIEKLKMELKLNNYNFKSELKTKRKSRTNKQINMKMQPRDNIQKNAIKFLTNLPLSDNFSQKILSLATGNGKTYCAINAISKTKHVPLIMVDQDSIVEQWKTRIIEFTDTTEDEIYKISGSKSIDSLLKLDKNEISKYKFFIGIHRTFKNLMENKTLFDSFMEKIKITLKVYDEAHVEISNIFNMDMRIDCPSWYLTATPSRSDYREDKVFQAIYKNVPKYSGKSKFKKYSNVIIYKINSRPSVKEIEKLKTKYGFNGNEFSKLMNTDNYKMYEKELVNIIFGLINKDETRKTAVVFHLNSSVDLFYDKLKHIIERNNLKVSIGKFNGNIKKSERSKALDKDLIITTGKSFAKAIDVKDLECLINTVPFSSNTMAEQLMGRLRKIENKEVYYFDLIDIGYPQCKNQLYYKKKTYNKLSKRIDEVFRKEYK